MSQLIDTNLRDRAVRKMKDGMAELIRLGAVDTFDCTDFGHLVSRIEAHVDIAPQARGTELR